MSDFDDSTPPPSTIPNRKLLDLLKYHRQEAVEYAKSHTDLMNQISILNIENSKVRAYAKHLELRVQMLEEQLALCAKRYDRRK